MNSSCSSETAVAGQTTFQAETAHFASSDIRMMSKQREMKAAEMAMEEEEKVHWQRSEGWKERQALRMRSAAIRAEQRTNSTATAKHRVSSMVDTVGPTKSADSDSSD